MLNKIIVKNYLQNSIRNQNFTVHIHFLEDFLNIKINQFSN